MLCIVIVYLSNPKRTASSLTVGSHRNMDGVGDMRATSPNMFLANQVSTLFYLKFQDSLPIFPGQLTSPFSGLSSIHNRLFTVYYFVN